jgi:hypothetical protein
MQPGLGPVQQSLVSWITTSLGFKYTILLPLSALAGFVLTLIIVTRGKGPMAGVALVFSVPIPLLVGVFAAIEGGVNSFREIAAFAQEPATTKIAAAISTCLVAPMVGMLLTAPSYIVATVGALSRSFTAVVPKRFDEGAIGDRISSN